MSVFVSVKLWVVELAYAQAASSVVWWVIEQAVSRDAVLASGMVVWWDSSSVEKLEILQVESLVEWLFEMTEAMMV